MTETPKNVFFPLNFTFRSFENYSGVGDFGVNFEKESQTNAIGGKSDLKHYLWIKFSEQLSKVENINLKSFYFFFFNKQGWWDRDWVSNLAQVIGKLEGEFAPNSSLDVYTLTTWPEFLLRSSSLELSYRKVLRWCSAPEGPMPTCVLVLSWDPPAPTYLLQYRAPLPPCSAQQN